MSDCIGPDASSRIRPEECRADFVDLMRQAEGRGWCRYHADGYFVVLDPILVDLLVATHTRKGLGSSPVVDDWPRGSGLATTPVEKQVPFGTPLPSSEPPLFDLEVDEANGWPR